MSDRIEIAAGERGVVRLFAVDLPKEALEGFATPAPDWPLKAALGAAELNPDYVEVFEARDVADIGLGAYLVQGAGVAEAAIADDRGWLAALEGPLAIVTSGAFGGTAMTLSPRAPLRWLGTWHEERAPVRFAPLPSEAARGHGAPREGGGRVGLPGRAVALVALVVAAAIVGLLLWAGMRP